MLKFNFRERVLRAYACIMRTLFPTHCVKSLTLNYIKTKRGSRKNENADMFLPGKDKELRAIKKLQFGMEEIRQRQWSPETEIELLKQSNFALVSRIKNEAALNIVVEHGYISPICEAMNVFTPSKGYLLNLIRHWNKEKLFSVIEGVPSAFDSLKEWDILGVTEKQAYEGKELWAVARALVNAKPEKWAPKFIAEVMKIVPSRLNEHALAALECFVEVAIENRVDISTSTPYLMVIHPDLYVKLRIALTQEGDPKKFYPYVKLMFPQLVTKLDNNFGAIYAKEGPSAWARSKKKLTEAQEAAVWLSFALRPTTIDLVVDNLSAIKSRVSEKAFQSVEDDVFMFSTGTREILSLMKFYKDDAQKQEELREKLLGAASPHNALRQFYPFNGWKEDQAERAVRAMAVGKTLPEDLSALSVELQAAAIQELEIQSEMAAIGSTCLLLSDQEKLMEQKLHARSEIFLFQKDYNWHEMKAHYIISNKMEEESFRALVNFCGTGYQDDENRIRKLIFLHAHNWGLSAQNYKDLMQSPLYADLGARLKSYVQKAGRVPSFEDGV